jgi:hypothetical protein
MAALTFDDFTEDLIMQTPATAGDAPYFMDKSDYFVGFNAAVPGGERKWSLSAIQVDFQYKFPVLNGVHMTVLIDGSTGSRLFPSNPAYLTAVGFTIVSTSGSAGTYTLTFGSGVMSVDGVASADYAFFAQAYKSSATSPIFCYATTKTSTQLIIKCANSAGTLVAPDQLSVHLVLQG